MDSVTDAMLLAEMKRKIGGMVNDRVPDVSRLFANELKMDLSGVDVEARIARYFMSFDRLVEESGLSGMLGRGPAVGEGMKMRCKLLLIHVTPEILKVDLTRMVELTHREAKVNDLVLHDLVIERATRQQQYYLMQSEMKQNSTLRPKEDVGTASKTHQRPFKQQPRDPVAPVGGRNVAGPRNPPRDGCLIYKGSHWARDCPTATAEQKAGVERMLCEKKYRPQERVKRIIADGEPGFRSAVINGVLDVPFCPDTGSDVNIIGRPVMAELRELMPGLRTTMIDPPVEVVAAGGNTMLCHEKVQVDLQIVTAAGPLRLTNIECLVLDAPEEELLLGRTTLQSIGVDLDGVFEQLAQQSIEAAEAEADDIPSDHVNVLGTREDNEVETVLHGLVDEAIAAGFEPTRAEDLRNLVMEYSDVFRVRLGHDAAAEVEPLEVRLVGGAQPYRSGVRRYPEAQRTFLREYVRELEAAGLVERNKTKSLGMPGAAGGEARHW
ncbi:hypothetical protein PC110_g21891 [Phytophthora cactorum]|uniref:Aspartic peptidase domain n=2 Tax=Phytophthora cactorum TaxID=29920 RepID=A0A329RAJ8_9STRA|nr:hypothetical protein PC110_g21891 [Phytophthora cactorum]